VDRLGGRVDHDGVEEVSGVVGEVVLVTSGETRGRHDRQAGRRWRLWTLIVALRHFAVPLS